MFIFIADFSNNTVQSQLHDKNITQKKKRTLQYDGKIKISCIPD